MYLYNRSEYNNIKQECNIFFREISGGIYQVIKDRWNTYPKFVETKIVAMELSKSEKIAIQRTDGFIMCNDVLGLNIAIELQE